MDINEQQWRSHVQDGVVRRTDAVASGWTAGAIAHRTTNGRWQIPLPGVLLTSSGVPSDRQRLRAALCWAGPGAALTAVSGCRLHGLEAWPMADVHVAVPHERRRLPAAFRTGGGAVVAYRTHRVLEVRFRQGLPVLPPARCVVDACLRGPRGDEVRALVAAAVQTRRVTVEQLAVELAAAPRQGSALLRSALEEVSAGARSLPEAELLRAMRTIGLTGYEVNADVTDGAGRWLARADVVFRRLRLIVEVDGQRWHLSPERWQADLARTRRLIAAGWTVLRFSAAQVLADSVAVAREIASVAARRSAA